MIRTLFIIAGAGLVLATACIGGAVALGGRDLAQNGWAWTLRDDNGESVRFERIRGGGTADLGPVITRTLAWTGGSTLGIDSAITVEYVQGAEAGVVVTGPKGLADRVTLIDGRLSLSDGEERVVFGWNENGPTARSERDELRVVVTAPGINSFDVEGSGDLTLNDYDQDTLSIDISGSGAVTGTGRTRALQLDISGSGEADLEGLSLTDANVTIAGSGDATLAPTGRADIAISGSGGVDLLGRPATLNQNISGSGEVSIRNARTETAAPNAVSRTTITRTETRQISQHPRVSVQTTTTEAAR